MPQVTINTTNSGKPAPRWYRKFKKIWINTETLLLGTLVIKYPAESPIFLVIKLGSSWVLENLETLLANGQVYADAADTTAEAETKPPTP